MRSRRVRRLCPLRLAPLLLRVVTVLPPALADSSVAAVVVADVARVAGSRVAEAAEPASS
jgi:hypothetical protein